MAGISGNVMGRVVVGLRGHDSKEAPKIANFFTCLVHHFAANELSATVNCILQNDMLVLCPSTGHTNGKIQSSISENAVLECVQLQHSPECPFWKLQETRTSVTPYVDKKINVGVAILVESSDAHIFMTQRSDQMRSFPRAWVPPGGTLERGETLLHCALRELQEESGLSLNLNSTKTQLLCLWESVYPGFLGIGEPRAHHLVFYFLAKTNETWKELQEKVKMDPEEVKACAWLSEDSVRHLCRAKRKIVQQFIFGEDGEMKPAQLDLSHMFHSAMFRDGKIYSGSQMALNIWLDQQAAIVLGDLRKINQSTVSRIIRRVSTGIAQRLQQFIKFPSTEQKYASNRNLFYEMSQFPGVTGVTGTLYTHSDSKSWRTVCRTL